MVFPFDFQELRKNFSLMYPIYTLARYSGIVLYHDDDDDNSNDYVDYE